MSARTVHVVGAGLAGLAAAVSLAADGWHRVELHEAAGFAGGRCRSYFDRELGCRIDNGNHLLLSGNRDALAYLRTIGAEATFDVPAEPAFPFMDVGTGERWTLRPGLGRLPTWVMDETRRVPGSRPGDYLGILRLAVAGGRATVAETLDTSGALFRRLWGPVAVAALNTEPEAASASCLWAVIRESFARGGAACLPMVARDGLSESLVEPALAYLGARGAQVSLGHRLKGLGLGRSRVERLEFADGIVEVGPDDGVVLAAPAPVVASLVPGLEVPREFRSILNLHFLRNVAMQQSGFVGLVGGLAEWVFARRETVSVTVSAADRHLDRGADELAAEAWRDVGLAMGLPPSPPPPWRLVKEKRATFAATPAELDRRPAQRTRWANLALAGDWTDTGLPATIEGAIRSGRRAACVMAG